MEKTTTTVEQPEPIIDPKADISCLESPVKPPESKIVDCSSTTEKNTSENDKNDCDPKKLTITLEISKDIDILLIGKTGKGKSALGNSLLARKAFVSTADVSSVTDVIKAEHGSFNGRVLKVVDTPGVCDTRMSEEDSIKMVSEKMNDAIQLNPEGYHAFIYVLKFGERFTEEDVTVLQILKKIFGDDFVNKFCILVLTCGDNFEKQVTKETEMTFTEWCAKQHGVFKQLLDECEGRIVLFDNFTDKKEKKEKQIADLIYVIDRLQSSGKRYTNKYFDHAKETRDKLLIECKFPALKDKILKETGIIMLSYNQMNFEDPESKKESLLNLKEKTKALLHYISNEDNNSGAFNSILKMARKIDKMVENDINLCELLIKERRKYSEERACLLIEIDKYKTKIDVLEKSENRNVENLSIEIDELTRKLEQAETNSKKEEVLCMKKLSEVSENFNKEIEIYKKRELFYKEEMGNSEKKVKNLEQQMKNQLKESINTFQTPDKGGFDMQFQKTKYSEPNANMRDLKLKQNFKEDMQRIIVQYNQELKADKETSEQQIRELNLKVESQKAQHDMRIAHYESKSSDQKKIYEEMLAFLEMKNKEQSKAHEETVVFFKSKLKNQKESLKQKFELLESKIKDQTETYEQKFLYLQFKEKELKENSDQKLKDLKSKEKKLKKKYETKLAVLESKAVKQKLMNEQKIAELESNTKEQKEFYKQQKFILETRVADQKEINEQKLAYLESKIKDQKHMFKLKIADLEAQAIDQKETNEHKIAHLELNIKDQKEMFQLKKDYLISIANEQKETYEQRIKDLESKIKVLKESHRQKLNDLALLDIEQKQAYKSDLELKNKYIEDLENRLVHHIVRRTMYIFDREHEHVVLKHNAQQEIVNRDFKINRQYLKATNKFIIDNNKTVVQKTLTVVKK